MKEQKADLDLTKFPSTPFVKVTQEIKYYWENQVVNNVLKQLYHDKKYKFNTRLWGDLEYVQEGLDLDITINRTITLKVEGLEIPIQLHLWMTKDVDIQLKPYMLKNLPSCNLGAEFVLPERNYHIPLGYTSKTEKVFKIQLHRIHQSLVKIRKENNLVGEVRVTRTSMNQTVQGYLENGAIVRLVYSQSGILREKYIDGELVDLYKKFGEVEKPKVIRTGSSSSKKSAKSSEKADTPKVAKTSKARVSARTLKTKKTMKTKGE